MASSSIQQLTKIFAYHNWILTALAGNALSIIGTTPLNNAGIPSCFNVCRNTSLIPLGKVPSGAETK